MDKVSVEFILKHVKASSFYNFKGKFISWVYYTLTIKVLPAPMFKGTFIQFISMASGVRLVWIKKYITRHIVYALKDLESFCHVTS